MPQKISELAQELGVTTESLKNFIEDFDLDLSECLFPNLEVKEDFAKFAKENRLFLQKYEKDLTEEKSSAQIASEINQPLEKVEAVIKKNKPNLFENGLYKSSVSSFGIDNKLGGNYSFVYDYFGNLTSLTQRDFIGYRDLYFYITEMLNPFIDETQAKDWGIQKPAGIVLYGPKGSGKIFWAKKIAEIINYEFKEVFDSYLKTTFNNGRKTDFNDFLSSIMKQNKVLLFLENFDEIAKIKPIDDSIFSKNESTKDIILGSIHKFVSEDLLMVVSATNLTGIDNEIFAPGRFDIKIPVFPPNEDERAQMIMQHLMVNLSEDSVLMKILDFNGADHKPFWSEYAKRMNLFSNTMVIDFTQSVKKRLRNVYLHKKTHEFKIEKSLLEASFIECASKLTEDYLDEVQQFIREVSANDYDVFATRIEAMKKEFQAYIIKEKPTRKIGFNVED